MRSVMENKWRIIAGIAVFISITLLVIPKIFPVGMLVATASGGTVPMEGFYAYQAEFLVSLAALLVAGALFFLRGTEARRLAGLFLALLGVIIILLPLSWVIGVCPDDNHFTVAWTISGGILLVVAGGFAAGLACKAEIKNREEDDIQDAADHQA